MANPSVNLFKIKSQSEVPTLRRSNSQSNIPLAKIRRSNSQVSMQIPKLRRSSSQSSLPVASIGRSQSISRISNVKSENTPQPGSSSTIKSKQTPLSKNRPSMRPSTSHAPSATKRHLVNDKRQVQEQFYMVQEFVIDNPNLFDPTKIDLEKLNTPTVNVFVQVCKAMLGEIFYKLEMNDKNYKEVLMEKLKLLKYPVPISTSTLKIINTIHNFHHAVSIWSFLMKLVRPHTVSRPLEKEDRNKHDLNESILNCIINSYLESTGLVDGEELSADEKLQKDIQTIYNTETYVIEELEKKVAQKQDTVAKMLRELKIIENEKAQHEKYILQMEEQIENTLHDLHMRQEYLDIKLENLRSLKSKKGTLVDQQRAAVESTQEKIKNQKFTLADHVRLAEEAKDLKKEIFSMRDKIDAMMQVKASNDDQTVQLSEQVENIVTTWNNSLIKLSIQRPELKCLMLRQSGFHKADFKQEVEQVLQNIDIIQNSYKQKKLEIETKRKQERADLIDLDNKLKIQEALKKEITEINNKIKEEGGKAKEQAEEAIKLERDFKEKQEVFTTEIVQVQNNIENLLVQEQDIRKQQEDLAKNSVKFFVAVNKQVVETLHKMDKIMVLKRQKNDTEMEKIMVCLEMINKTYDS